VATLDLPYLPTDPQTVSVPGEEQVVGGYELVRPDRWLKALPEGWWRMPALPPPLAGQVAASGSASSLL